MSLSAPTTPISPSSPLTCLHQAVSNYVPQLDGEIALTAGDIIASVKDLGNGWCLGKNISAGNVVGIFPSRCVRFLSAFLTPASQQQHSLDGIHTEPGMGLKSRAESDDRSCRQRRSMSPEVAKRKKGLLTLQTKSKKCPRVTTPKTARLKSYSRNDSLPSEIRYYSSDVGNVLNSGTPLSDEEQISQQMALAASDGKEYEGSAYGTERFLGCDFLSIQKKGRWKKPRMIVKPNLGKNETTEDENRFQIQSEKEEDADDVEFSRSDCRTEMSLQPKCPSGDSSDWTPPLQHAPSPMSHHDKPLPNRDLFRRRGRRQHPNSEGQVGSGDGYPEQDRSPCRRWNILQRMRDDRARGRVSTHARSRQTALHGLQDRRSVEPSQTRQRCLLESRWSRQQVDRTFIVPRPLGEPGQASPRQGRLVVLPPARVLQPVTDRHQVLPSDRVRLGWPAPRLGPLPLDVLPSGLRILRLGDSRRQHRDDPQHLPCLITRLSRHGGHLDSLHLYHQRATRFHHHNLRFPPERTCEQCLLERPGDLEVDELQCRAVLQPDDVVLEAVRHDDGPAERHHRDGCRRLRTTSVGGSNRSMMDSAVSNETCTMGGCSWAGHARSDLIEI